MWNLKSVVVGRIVVNALSVAVNSVLAVKRIDARVVSAVSFH
jgi:hypothetical protein